MTIGHGQVQHIGIEIMAAVPAIVLGIRHVQIARPAADGVAQFVQRALGSWQARGAAVTLRTALTGIVALAFNDQRFGKVFDANDAFRGLGQIDSGRHGDSLLA